MDRNKELGFGRQNKRRTPRENTAYFTDLANAYLAAKVGHIQNDTLDNIQWTLDSILLPYFGHMRASRITPYIADLFVQKRLQEGVKRTTVHRNLCDLMAILNWAAKRRYIISSPSDGLGDFKIDCL